MDGVPRAREPASMLDQWLLGATHLLELEAAKKANIVGISRGYSQTMGRQIWIEHVWSNPLQMKQKNKHSRLLGGTRHCANIKIYLPNLHPCVTGVGSTSDSERVQMAFSEVKSSDINMHPPKSWSSAPLTKRAAKLKVSMKIAASSKLELHNQPNG